MDLAAILDITPPSPEEHESFSPVHLTPTHGSLSPIPSPPKKVFQSKLTEKMKMLERENKVLKAMLDGMKKANSKMRVQKHFWIKVRKHVNQPSDLRRKEPRHKKYSKLPTFFPGMKTAGSCQGKGILYAGKITKCSGGFEPKP